MKALILTDIHANIIALEAIWARERDSDVILCAGDLVDYGPFPKEVLDWVREHAVRCVRGNHDTWVARQFRAGLRPEHLPGSERTWAHYNAELLDEADIEFIERLPLVLTMDLDGITYGISHQYRDYEELLSLQAFSEFSRQAFGDDAITRLIFGHTHRQAIRYLGNVDLWLNPGSASYRRQDDLDQTAHYATITDGALELRRLPYDLAPLREALRHITLQESEMRVATFFFGNR